MQFKKKEMETEKDSYRKYERDSLEDKARANFQQAQIISRKMNFVCYALFQYVSYIFPFDR